MESNSISEADRCTTVSWLMEVVAACGLQPATLFLAVSYLDRFLAASKVRRGVVRVQGSTLLVQAKVSDLCCYSSLASRQALHIKDVQSYLLAPHPTFTYQGVTTSFLQLVATASLSLATKQEEVSYPHCLPTLRLSPFSFVPGPNC